MEWQQAISTRYRVWYIRNSVMHYAPADSPDEAKQIVLAQMHADLADASVIMNAFGLEQHEVDGWHEWYDDNDNSIEDLADATLDREGIPA